MSTQVAFAPHENVCAHASDMLQGMAASLDRLIEWHLDRVGHGEKASAIEAMLPTRRLVFEAQQLAAVLRDGVYVVADDIGGNVGIVRGEGAAVAEKVNNRLLRAFTLMRDLLNAMTAQRAYDA